MLKLSRVLLAAVLVAGSSAPSWSDTPAASDTTSVQLEEVTVTARKSVERLEDVPLSITDYSTKELAERGIVGLKDIAQLTPGFVYQEYTSSFDSSPTIRGLTQFDVTSSVANVSTVVNGVYVPRNYSVDLGIADVSRVDIVKGPQSALYGGNAFAGVIAYTLGQPTDKPHVDLGVTAGTHGRIDTHIAASGPLIQDLLQGRVYYATSDYHGSWGNNYPVSAGSSQQDVGGHDNKTYGAALKFTPTSELEADADYFHLSRHEDIKPGYSVTSTDLQNKFNCGAGNQLICGTLSTNPAGYQSALSTRPGGILQPDQPGFTSGTDFLDVRLKAQLTPDLTASYLFGHVVSWATEITAPSDNPVSGAVVSYAALLSGGFAFGPYTNDQKEGGSNNLDSNEFRLEYSANHLKALLGFYYTRDQDNYQFNIWQVQNGDPVGGNGNNPFDFTGFPFGLVAHQLQTDTTAEFGRLAYGLLDDRLTLAAEVRHSADSLNYEDEVAKVNQRATFDTTTPRFTLDYKLTAESMLYLSGAQGIKEGGFNGVTGASGLFDLLPSQQVFQPEKNWTYEVGTKNSFFGGRAILNADLFLVKWSNLQIQEQPLNTPAALADVTSVITTNLGAATSKGLETDGQFLVTPNLELTFALAVIDPTFNDGTYSARFAGYCDNIACPANNSVGGKTLPRTSKVQAAGGATWKDKFMTDYEWNVHGEFTYQSQQQVEEVNAAQIPSRLLFNASAGIRSGNWDATLWGKNVLNKRYVADSYFILAGSAAYNVSFGELATAGVTLNYHY